MNSARQVCWVKALVVLVCAESFNAMRVSAWQYYPKIFRPPGPSSSTAPQIYSRRQLPSMIVHTPSKKTRPGVLKSSGEVTCAVLSWEERPPVTMLTVTCPPANVLSPLRLLLHMSWNSPEEIREKSREVVAEPNTLTKVRIPVKDREGKPAASVKLQVRHNGGGKVREKWVVFNRVTVDVEAD